MGCGSPSKFKYAKYWRKNIHEMRDILGRVNMTVDLIELEEDDLSENQEEIVGILKKVCVDINKLLDKIREDIIIFSE